MDSGHLWNPNAKRLLNESSYTLYMQFMAILFGLASQLHQSLNAGSLKQLRIAITIFVINFVVAWWAFEQSTHHEVVRSQVVAFHIIFYITMILAPGFLLSTLVLESLDWHPFFGYIHDKFRTVWDSLLWPRTPTVTNFPETMAQTATHDNVETESSTFSGHPNTDIGINFVATAGSSAIFPHTMPLITTNGSVETENEVAFGRPSPDIETNHIATFSGHPNTDTAINFVATAGSSAIFPHTMPLITTNGSVETENEVAFGRPSPDIETNYIATLIG